jgi:hypothetical protein
MVGIMGNNNAEESDNNNINESINVALSLWEKIATN